MKNKFDSFAFYKLPNETQIQFISGNVSNKRIPIHQIPSDSFIISPFNQGNQAYYIQKESKNTRANFESLIHHFSKHQYSNFGKNHFIHLVQTGIRKILEGQMKKVVLANTKTLQVQKFDALNYFHKLSEKYPNAFTCYFSSPKTGTWIGASPEPLLHYRENNYQLVSLAGSKKSDENIDWSDKEYEEQEMVSIYLESILKKTKIAFKKKGPLDFNTGMMVHLRTEFSIGNPKIEVAEDLIRKLNPTPAVAGIPKKRAIEFIKINEGFDRRLYTGFLGIKGKEHLRLFVNLRCMEIHQNAVTIFAGAGITKDSVPENEWEETQNKMNTLEILLNERID